MPKPQLSLVSSKSLYMYIPFPKEKQKTKSLKFKLINLAYALKKCHVV